MKMVEEYPSDAKQSVSEILRQERAAVPGMPHPARGTVFTFVLVPAVLFILLAGASHALHAQSAPSISIALSPGHQVPMETAVTGTGHPEQPGC